MHINQLAGLAEQLNRLLTVSAMVDTLMADVGEPFRCGEQEFCGPDAERLRHALVSSLGSISEEARAKLLRANIEFSELTSEIRPVAHAPLKVSVAA